MSPDRRRQILDAAASARLRYADWGSGWIAPRTGRPGGRVSAAEMTELADLLALAHGSLYQLTDAGSAEWAAGTVSPR